MKHLNILLALLFMVFGFPTFIRSEPEHNAETKQNQIRYALEKGVLTPYDFSFHTYLELEMWDEIDHILRACNAPTHSRYIDDPFISRPYPVNGRIYVFSNTGTTPASLRTFDFETLSPLKVPDSIASVTPKDYIRYAHDPFILTGGSLTGTLSLWDTRNGEKRNLTLPDDHPIISVTVENNRIFIGRCGGDILEWNMEDLSPQGSYGIPGEDSENRASFHRRECMVGLHLWKNHLIGAGQHHFFFWDRTSRQFVKKTPRDLPSGTVIFYKDIIIEYSGRRIRTHNTDDRFMDAPVCQEKIVPLPIADLIVTDTPILPGQKGAAIVCTLRNNQGLLFLDLNPLSAIQQTRFPGDSLSCHNGILYTTSPNHIFRYDFRQYDSAGCEQLAASLFDQDTILRPDQFSKMLLRTRDFPGIIPPEKLCKRYLESHGLFLQQSIHYGKLPSYTDQTESDGYRIDFSIENRKKQAYLLTLAVQWSPDDEGDHCPEPTRLLSQQLIIPSLGRTPIHRVILENRAPGRILMVPELILEIDAPFFHRITRAMGGDDAGPPLY